MELKPGLPLCSFRKFMHRILWSEDITHFFTLAPPTAQLCYSLKLNKSSSHIKYEATYGYAGTIWHKTNNLSISTQHMAISWTRKHCVAQDNASFITRSTLKLNKLMLANAAPEINSFIISMVCFVMIQRFRPLHISTSAAARPCW